MELVLIGDACEVLIGRGLPDSVLPQRSGREAVAILHQKNSADVAASVEKRLESRVLTRQVPDRDAAKTLQSVGDVYEWLAAENVGRYDTIVGVGGGAVTDLAGFVAATWMRGVESVLIPTTLLAAVDASIGGKTAINVKSDLPGVGKNMVGVFWNPTRVIVDLDLLAGLPTSLIVEGSAEILKAGLLADQEIVEAYVREGIDTRLDFVVPRAIVAKASIVREDLREAGHRAILNFGHTIGHGVEAVTGIPHGFAVSVGMAAEAAISAMRYGFDDLWLTSLIFSLGLPVAVGGASAKAVTGWMARDKKRDASGTRMVLLRGICDPVVDVVTDDEVQAGLRAIGVV